MRQYSSAHPFGFAAILAPLLALVLLLAAPPGASCARRRPPTTYMHYSLLLLLLPGCIAGDLGWKVEAVE